MKLDPQTVFPLPPVASRRADTVCWRDSLAKLSNTPQPSLENMDHPKPLLSALISSPTRSMKILPPLQLLCKSLTSSRRSMVLLIFLEITSSAELWMTELSIKPLNYQLKIKRFLMNWWKFGMVELKMTVSTLPLSVLAAKKNLLPPESKRIDL